MTESITATTKRIPTAINCLFFSVSIIFFLFYIDEGYYNFNWMKEPGNWIAFGLYLAGFSLGQLIANFIFLMKYKGIYKTTLTSVIGIPLGFGLILLFFVFLKHLYS